ncbi:hypothetical protein, partial [Klebsiella pneumoniae]|uniref:hypothetical protein n=1 Tax=Klebsiella pneumoniae TaxID=573 RepID=UPI003EE063A0
WFACGLPTKERYFGTDTIFDCILFGCLAAMAQKFWNDKIQRYILSEQIFYTAILIMIGTVLCRDDLFRHTIRFSLQAASAAVIILNLA